MTDDSQIGYQKPRNPWLAGLLAFFCQGLGHVYVGRPLLGIALFAIPIIFFTLVEFIAIITDTAVLDSVVSEIVLSLVIWLSQIVWAITIAYQDGKKYRLRKYNHVFVYIAFFLTTYLIGQSDSFLIDSLEVPERSMVPALDKGEAILVTKIGFDKLQRGDIVLLERPKSRTLFSSEDNEIKRIIGLPGEHISVENGLISINDKPITRKKVDVAAFSDFTLNTGKLHSFEAEVFEEQLGNYLIKSLKATDISYRSPDIDTILIPEGHYFVMGDNRDHSKDSRTWGAVPAENIIGRCHTIYFSWGVNGFRNERFGEKCNKQMKYENRF